MLPAIAGVELARLPLDPAVDEYRMHPFPVILKNLSRHRATMDARIPMTVVMWFFLRWIYGAFTGLFIPPLRKTLAGYVDA